MTRKENIFRHLVRTFLMCTLLAYMQDAVAVVLSDASFYRAYPFIYVLEDGEEPQPLTDEQFFDMAAKVKFPVNKSVLPQGNPLLQELAATVIPHINADSLQLVHMVFRGAASPEGDVEQNRQLGQQRVQALYDYVTGLMLYPSMSRLTTIETDIEDYRSLLLMMQRANDSDYPVVKELCDQHLGQDLAQLKQKLKAVGNGRLWLRLLNTYFPDLRTARFVIYLRKVRPVAPSPSMVPMRPTIPTTLTKHISPIVPVSPITASTDSILPRREMLAVKTNLLFYGVYMPGYNRWCPIPNIAVEYYPKHGHFTYGASFDCPWWQDYDAHKYFQVRNYQVEARYYLKTNEANEAKGSQKPNKPAYAGFYLQGYAHLGLFGICFDANRGWVGEGAGGGIGLGYVTPISKKGHWRLEFGLQAGFFRCKYDPYQYENPVDPTYHDDLYYYKWTLEPELFKKRQYRWNWIGPTRIGITLSYDLLYRRQQKRGASFKATETQETHPQPLPIREGSMNPNPRKR